MTTVADHEIAEWRLSVFCISAETARE